ncbi:MAG: hypothetical protein FD147_932 [Chloroflexi bacterium]|nr:MAG: hypothetical protein FD147_932 [Chloroflexota bacterium]
MNYFRSLIPTSHSTYLNSPDVLKIWQEKILQSMLIIGSLFGIILSIYAIAPAISSHNWTFFFGSLILAIVSTSLFLLRKISYWFRSTVALIAVYLFANVVFFRSGWGGLSLFLLLGFSFLSTTFLFKRPTRIGIGISIVTLLFWVILRYTNIVPTIGTSASPYNIIIDVLLTFLVGTAGNLAIDSLRSMFLEEHAKTENTKTEIFILEEKLSLQKVDLEKRLYQLRTAAEISQTVSSILDPQFLIQQVAEFLRNRFSLYYVGIFLIDESREYAVLRYGTGEAGRQMLASKHRLAVGGYSMIGWATQTRKSRIALDTGVEAVRFDNPLLPQTRSELALPIISGIDILGAMSIQSENSNAFDENDIMVLQGIADSLAVALENANSFQKTQKAIEDIRVLNRAYVQQAWWDTLDLNKELKFDFENPLVTRQEGASKSIQVPLILRDEVIGSINLEIEGSDIPQDQYEFLQTVSAQTSIALENARLLEETQLAAIQEQKLNELTSQFSRALTIEDILKTAVLEFGKLHSVSEATITLLPPEEYISPGIKSISGKEES